MMCFMHLFINMIDRTLLVGSHTHAINGIYVNSYLVQGQQTITLTFIYDNLRLLYRVKKQGIAYYKYETGKAKS